MNARVVRHLARILGVAALLAAGGLAVLHQRAPAARAATSATVVTIQFDDGNADVYQALGILNAHGMHATFYLTLRRG
jgi:peptidoglycan/xylan/chitin deacetylase (PgdA/CDA1 family)